VCDSEGGSLGELIDRSFWRIFWNTSHVSTKLLEVTSERGSVMADENKMETPLAEEKPAQEDLPKTNGETAGPLETTTPETLPMPSPVKAR